MRYLRPRLATLAAVTMLIGGTGCIHRGKSSKADEPMAPREAVSLRVKNENYLDMDVYVVNNGMQSRVGMVTGNTSQNFTLSGSMFPSQNLRVTASPIGGTGRATSPQLAVYGGQLIEFRIGSVLRQSSAVVRDR